MPPHPDDFESWEDYEAARISYYSNKAVREATQPLLEEIKKLSGAKAETEAQKVFKTFEKRQKEFAKTHSDYMDVVSNLEGIHVDASVEQAIVHSALGPEILYELGKNPDLAEEIAELPPHLQLKEIGKLEAKIEARLEAKKLAAAKPTKAPPPPNPVGQKSDGRKSIDDPNLSTLEFFTLRNEQERKRWGDFL